MPCPRWDSNCIPAPANTGLPRKHPQSGPVRRRYGRVRSPGCAQCAHLLFARFSRTQHLSGPESRIWRGSHSDAALTQHSDQIFTAQGPRARSGYGLCPQVCRGYRVGGRMPSRWRVQAMMVLWQRFRSKGPSPRTLCCPAGPSTTSQRTACFSTQFRPRRPSIPSFRPGY
jgi:hypothetical protein